MEVYSRPVRLLLTVFVSGEGNRFDAKIHSELIQA